MKRNNDKYKMTEVKNGFWSMWSYVHRRYMW